MRFLAAFIGTLLVSTVGAQSTPPAHRTGVAVRGTVFDSLSGKPLPLAGVQLVGTDTGALPVTTVADSLGNFAFFDVARGRYLIGFFHPLLDSLTIQPILRELYVGGGAGVRVDLATPSPSRLRTAFCGQPPAKSSAAALVGIVRDARDGSPVAGASVTADWTDLVIGAGQMVRRLAAITSVSATNGWFVLCGVPGPGSVTLSAHRGADSTDHIDLQVPAGGFLRRELYVGSVRSGPPRSGDGRVSGRVLTSRLDPLAGARVSISGGPHTVANALGEWTLTEAPSGTRMLEVRAIGYYPERRAVDITPATLPVVFALATFQSVLDTVRIRANAPTESWSGFEDRRRSSGTGRFITEEDIRRWAPTSASAILHIVPGLRVSGTDIKMRGAFTGLSGTGDCTPFLFVDGKLVSMPSGMRPDDIDMWVNPSEIRGIEVYPDAPPPQFQVALSGCGSIVIWTKRMAGR